MNNSQKIGIRMFVTVIMIAIGYLIVGTEKIGPLQGWNYFAFLGIIIGNLITNGPDNKNK